MIKIIWENIFFPFQTWRLCALAGGISESESLRLSEYLRPVVHYDKHVGFSFRIVVHAFSQTALGKRGSPVGEQPQPKAELSPAKAQR